MESVRRSNRKTKKRQSADSRRRLKSGRAEAVEME